MSELELWSSVDEYVRGSHTGRADSGAGVASVEVVAPRMHYESRDSFPGWDSCALDWRAEIHVAVLDEDDRDSSLIVAGFVDFLVVRLGRTPIAPVLDFHGAEAAAFGELFDGPWLAGDLDETEDLTDGMPIFTALLVLGAHLDAALAAHGRVRPWAVSQVVHTMLPTTAGLVVMPSFSPTAGPVRPRRLVAADRLDPDWSLVGCKPLPGHPRFSGQATMYTYLEDARDALADVAQQPMFATHRPL